MGFFGTLFTPIENLLHFVLEALYSITDLAGIGSYGLAIILLTITTCGCIIALALTIVWAGGWVG